MSRIFSPAQTAYLVARAHLDTLKAEFFAVAPVCPDSDDDTALDAYEDAYTAARVAIGMSDAECALRNAEQALVDWSSACALAVARTDSARESVEIVRTRGMKSLTQRPKIIDLAMRLDAR